MKITREKDQLKEISQILFRKEIDKFKAVSSLLRPKRRNVTDGVRFLLRIFLTHLDLTSHMTHGYENVEQ